MERVAGIQTGGSERAFDLFMKARYLDQQHAGHGVIFATGTPIRTPCVRCTPCSDFLDPEGLRSRGLGAFRRLASEIGIEASYTEWRIMPTALPSALSHRNTQAEFFCFSTRTLGIVSVSSP